MDAGGGDRPGNGGRSSGGRMLRGSLALTSLLFMCCIPEAETTAPPQASPAVIAVFAALFGYRAYSGFDFVVEVSQNKTAEFITAAADAGINFIVQRQRCHGRVRQLERDSTGRLYGQDAQEDGEAKSSWQYQRLF